MKKRLTTALAAFAVITMMLLGGCGEEPQATLEDIASSNPELTKTIADELEAPAGMSAEVSFSGDSFDVNYRLDDPVDDDAEKILVKSYESNTDVLKESCEGAIEDLQTQTGITGITGTIHIFNASGDETWSHSFPEE